MLTPRSTYLIMSMFLLSLRTLLLSPSLKPVLVSAVLLLVLSSRRSLKRKLIRKVLVPAKNSPCTFMMRSLRLISARQASTLLIPALPPSHCSPSTLMHGPSLSQVSSTTQPPLSRKALPLMLASISPPSTLECLKSSPLMLTK